MSSTKKVERRSKMNQGRFGSPLIPIPCAMKRDEKLLKELELEEFDVFQKIYFMFDVAFSSSEHENEEIVYSKKFFRQYYCIDGETLSKWIKVFCPDLAGVYKTKRNFNSEEVNYIFENLGSLPYKPDVIFERKEAMQAIYNGYNWNKSRQYKEFSLMLKDIFPDIDIKLNKLPPKLMNKILKDENEELDENRVLNRNISHERRLNMVFKYLEMYKKMSPYDWEVRRRWFRRFMSADDFTDVEK